MKTIELTQEKYAVVDDKWYEYLNQWEWYYSSSGYAVRSENGHQILMHRVVMRVPEGIDLDHINKNRLDNREQNLRTCNDSQNQANTGKRITNTSGYKGVSLNKQTGRWTAQITVNKTRIHLGYFDFPEDAAKAYDTKAKEHFGEFAELNFN